MSRLIVVSNRVNPPTAAGEETVGGLAMGVNATRCGVVGEQLRFTSSEKLS